MRGRVVRSAQSEHRWLRIGRRLRARRKHLGLSVKSVARELEIKTDQYLAYEAGAELAPPLLLTRIAERFGVPAVWFFQNFGCKTVDDKMAAARLKGLYRVATLEDRINYLIDAFCRLDLDKQQQLLAVAGVLTHQKETKR
jgi:transcriptional regulator with XRE-family HTH domain